jgi:2-polyprenyl-3-methyl-5-hydroxy-6-metoxy-1,4-benzoquinol methylase
MRGIPWPQTLLRELLFSCVICTPNSAEEFTIDIKPLPILDHRLLKWDKKDLLKRACPFCSGEGQDRFTRPDGLPVRYCDVCGTYFVSDSPSEQALNDLYLHYCSRRYPDAPRPKGKGAQEAKSDFRIREIISNLETKDRDISHCSVLDVGCGTGRMLYKFQALGANVYGVDLDPIAPLIAKSKYGINNVSQGTLMECDKSVDVLLMIDFIEHPIHPLNELKAAVRLLNPGGLLVLWTPNATFASVEEYPICFRVDLEHMQYLTNKTCLYLSDALALEVIHLETVGFPDLAACGVNIGQKKGYLRWANTLKAAIATIIGQRGRRAVRALLTGNPSLTPDMRDGRYHLFCILRAPETVVA